MTAENSRPWQGPANVNGEADETSVELTSDKFWSDQQPKRASLEPRHRQQLKDSGISEVVIDGRGYRSVLRTNTDERHQTLLKANKISKAVWSDVQRFPGLLFPQYNVLGERVPGLYRPDRPRKNDRGRYQKYESPVGLSSVLDCHPFNRDRLLDPTVTLWITEGIKKADALTSLGILVISLAGVFNWRSRLGTLGDWENVPLRGRHVVLCFDSDARINRNVARAMNRLGAFMRFKGATVRYVIPPDLFADSGGKTGVDDYLGKGGTVDALLAAATSAAPDPDAGDISLTDSRLAERVADDVLADSFRFVQGLGWLMYDGRVWRECGDEPVIEETRRYFKKLFLDAADAGLDADALKALKALQSKGRITSVASLTKGMDAVLARAEEFDADPWLLNCANGAVDLRTGELYDHDPSFLFRHQATASYNPNVTHPDWTTALEALPDDETRDWVQVYLGTGITGISPREDVLTFWHGNGSNGKSTLLGSVQAALGDYTRMLLPSMLGTRRDEHPTEFTDLLGVRLAYVEESGDGQKLDVTKIKRYVGTDRITARRMRQDSFTFKPSHTLVFTTNYRPLVPDTDHGTWRRLRMVPFPKTYGGDDGLPIDEGLRARLLASQAQQEAVLAWLVAGAMGWYEGGLKLPPTPESIIEATRLWRESSDLLSGFVAERLVAAPRERSLDTEELREEFNEWLKPAHRPWGKQTFAERFEQHEAVRKLGAQLGKHSRSRRSCFFGLGWAIDVDDWKVRQD